MLSTWSVCSSFSFLGIEKADVRSFPNLSQFLLLLLKKYGSVTGVNLLSCNYSPCFCRPPLGEVGAAFERQLNKLSPFKLSPENKQGQKQKKKLYKAIDFAGGPNRTSRNYLSAGF